MEYLKLKEKLEKYNQQQLLKFYEELSEKQQQELLNQINNIDLEQVEELFSLTKKQPEKSIEDKIEPIKYIDRLKLSTEETEEYTKIGENILEAGKFAFVTLAGGQGTRLGHTGPKGTYKIGISPDKSLFEILCENLKRARNKYKVNIPWYIMTSRENNDDTIEFFKENNYFGYSKNYVKFFKQNELPMLDMDGKIILESKAKVREAADGHGGVFNAMHTNDIIQDMEKRNIKWCFIGGVDNVLLKMVDPCFIGLAESQKVKVASKSIVKASPDEKVGVFCKRNSRPSVIEYTEITDAMARTTDANGELLYGESHILCNLFSLEALKQIATEKLPYHVAFKKSSYIDGFGKIINPILPNAYKFEAFIFDAFSKFDDMLIYRSIRDEEFAPIKNKVGIDSVITARKLYKEYWNL